MESWVEPTSGCSRPEMTEKSPRNSLNRSRYGVSSYSAPAFDGKKYGAWSPSGAQMHTSRRRCAAGPDARAREPSHGRASDTPAAFRKARRSSFIGDSSLVPEQGALDDLVNERLQSVVLL